MARFSPFIPESLRDRPDVRDLQDGATYCNLPIVSPFCWSCQVHTEVYELLTNASWELIDGTLRYGRESPVTIGGAVPVSM